jgi:hypothetical protein
MIAPRPNDTARIRLVTVNLWHINRPYSAVIPGAEIQFLYVPVRIENGRTRLSYGENTDSLYGLTWLRFVYLREKQNLILQLSKMSRQYRMSDICFLSAFPQHIYSQFQCLSINIQINIDIHIYIYISIFLYVYVQMRMCTLF